MSSSPCGTLEQPVLSERADDLVGHQQDVVRVTDPADPVEVARRRDATAGVPYRPEEHGGDGLRTLEQDRLLDPVGCPAAEGLPVVAQMVRRAAPVGVGHPEPAGHERIEACLAPGMPVIASPGQCK